MDYFLGALHGKVFVVEGNSITKLTLKFLPAHMLISTSIKGLMKASKSSFERSEVN